MRWLVLVALAGCSHHERSVHITALRPTLTASQRLSAYAALRPVADHTTLANGLEVRAPEDFLPVVAPDSVTARNVHASSGYRHLAQGMLFAAGAAVLAGLAMHAPLEDRFYVAGVGGAAFGTAALALFGLSRRAEDHAHASYEVGLRERLRLCARGLEVVPCENGIGTIDPFALAHRE